MKSVPESLEREVAIFNRESTES